MHLFQRPALLFILALLFFAAGTWSLPLIDRDEPRFAEASREMRQRGDYIVPYLNNKYRFDKPPLTYWAQVASYTVFGENDFAARFPSVVAAAITVLLVYGLGTRLYGQTTGWHAALIFLTCLQASMHAKGAVADMLLVLFYVLAVWAAWELILSLDPKTQPPSSPTRWWWLFYGSLALGFLAKGPVAWFPLIGIAIYSITHRPAGMPKRFKWALGLLFVLAVVGAWGIPALIKTNGAFFDVGVGKHIVARSVTSMEGHGPKGWLTLLATLPFYFITLFLSFFPWSIQIPWFAKKTVERWKNRQFLPCQWFLIINILFVFGIFTLVRTKLPHYTLPALPLLAILLARELDLAVERRSNVVAWTRNTLLVSTAIFLFVFPFLGPLFPGRDLILKASGSLTPEMEFASTEFQEPSLIWYARKYVNGFYTPASADKLASFMAKPGPRFCVAPRGTLQPEPDWEVFESKGFNLARGKTLELEMLIKKR